MKYHIDKLRPINLWSWRAVMEHHAPLFVRKNDEKVYAEPVQDKELFTKHEQPKKLNALETQVGGNHYKKFAIQPVEFCYRNNIGYLEATAIKYLCRWKDKNGLQDLEKAKHFIDLLIEMETKQRSTHDY